MKRFLLVCTVLLIGLLFVATREHLVSIAFTDEQDNFTLGHYLLSGDYLYRDLFSHHQPLAYIGSAAIQRLAPINSIYLLVTRHRLAVFAYSTLWLLLLVWRFGPSGFLFALIFEPVKSLLLGQLFLSESLSVYPMVYLLGLVLSPHPPNTRETVLAGFCLGLIVFLLAPLWPLAFLFAAILISTSASKLASARHFLLGFLPLLLLVSLFVSWPDYFHSVFYINFHYYIPTEAGGHPLLKLVNSFATPVLALLTRPYTRSLPVIKSLSLLVLTYTAWLISTRRFLRALFLLTTLGLANIRFVAPGLEIYSGFHLLPWLAALAFISAHALTQAWRNSNSFLLKGISLGLLVTSFMFSLPFFASQLTIRTDSDTAMYVNYSHQYTLGRAVQVMAAGQQEQLFVAPVGWLIYWQSGLDHHNQMINFHDWMAATPELSGLVHQAFQASPPAYFYCECTPALGLTGYLDDYRELSNDSKPTHLYARSDKLDHLTPDQWQELEFLGFNRL